VRQVREDLTRRRKEAEDPATDKSLGVENREEESNRMEPEEEKMRICKRKIPDSEDKDGDEDGGVSTLKAKRRKVSAEQFSPAITNYLPHDEHLSSKINTEPQREEGTLIAPNKAINANVNVEEEISDAESDLSTVSNITELAPTPQKKPRTQLALPPARIHQMRAQVSIPITPVFTPTTPFFNPAELANGDLATEEQDGALGVMDPHRSYVPTLCSKYAGI
jgi:hypothetical protein